MKQKRTFLTKIKLVAILISLFSLVLPGLATADPLSSDERKEVGRDNSWSTTAECEVEDVDVGLTGSGNVQKAMNFFTSQAGFSPEQAAGIIGNFIEESGVNPRIVERGWGFPLEMNTVPPTVGKEGQPGYGIAQWTSPGRKDNLKKFGGNKVHTLSKQLQFVMEEMKNYPGLEQKLKSFTGDDTIAQSAFEFHRVYEGSADSPAQIQERVQSGRSAFAQYGGVLHSDTSTISDAGSCEENDSGGTFTGVDYGSKEELITKVLNNDNIVFGNYQDASVQRRDVQNCLTETTLAGFLAMAEQGGVKILVNALASDHGGCNPSLSSDHSKGRAIDIGYYGNGQPNHNADGDKLYKYLYKNAASLKVSDLIWTRPPAGYKCMDNGNPKDCSIFGASTVAQHVHHIHVSFKE